MLLLGDAKATPPQPLEGFPGCSLFTSVHVVVPVTLGANGVNRGYGFVELPWPLNTSGNNVFTLYGQGLALGTGPFAPGGVSDALEWQHEVVVR